MTLEETLVRFGLDQKEAKIYLALLTLGPATVLEIAKRAAVKRPTVYVLLEKMLAQGLVARTSSSGRTRYSAEPPDVLLRAIRTKEETLHEALPILQAMMAAAKKRPNITIHEGHEGLARLYDEIFESPDIRFFGSMKDLKRSFSDIVERFIQLSKRRKTRVRDLLTHHPVDLEWAHRAVSEHYAVRILPREFDFAIDCAIYGEKVAILSVKDDFFAVVIESKEVADSFRALHTLAWQSAIPLENV
jgi:sugar-specific transcriptional regulator TrmB